MLFEIILILALIPKCTKCSLVIDSTNQEGIYVSDYCPTMKHCPEGAHIMCMYYNPNSVMGPRCRNARNVTMTPELANKLLDVSNAIRSKIARGQEKGKNGEHFPRGYGIFRLNSVMGPRCRNARNVTMTPELGNKWLEKWDTELATFAQVLANQCVLRHDLCRATKRFSDPGQTAGLVRFSVPDWYPVSKSGNFSTPGLDNEKLLYATTQTMKSWYAQKSSVTVQMLTNYPDWTADPNRQNGRLYMEMIYGPATHMGCGLSAYTEYAFYDNNAALNYNSIQVICNFSARPRSGGAVYNTVPPIDLDNSFNTCGCPAGSIEDDDCLCHEVPKEPEPPMSLIHKAHKCPDGNCDPTVVLLPIFTIEDAPPNKLIPLDRFSNKSLGQLDRTEGLSSFEELINSNILENKKSIKGAPKITTKTKLNGQSQRSKSKNGVSVRYRHFDTPPKKQKNKQSRRTMNLKHRTSIFSKTPRFVLPGSSGFLTSFKKDVVARKDFSTGKRLVGKYLINKDGVMLPNDKIKFTNSYKYIMSGSRDPKSVETPNAIKDLHIYLHPKEQKNNLGNHDDVHFHDILTTENILNTAEQSVINHNKYMKDLNLTNNTFNKLAIPVENDHKIIALLNNLEQEVKHLELHDREKEILNAKIKKIYGNIVGKSVDLDGELKNNKKGVKDTALKEIVTKNDDDTNEDNSDVHKLEPPHDAVKYESNFGDHSIFHSKPRDTEVDGYEKYMKPDMNDIEPDSLSRKLISKGQIALINYNKRGKPYARRNRNDMRQRNQNDINSLELIHHKYDNDFRDRTSYNNNKYERGIFRNRNGKAMQRGNTGSKFKSDSYYVNDYWDDDPLSEERRKFYQDKLDNIERKLQEVRHSNRRKAVNRPMMRAMRPSVRSDSHIGPMYTSGRARFIHGY